MNEYKLPRWFCRFAFWMNVISITSFVVDVLILRKHHGDLDYFFAFVNTVFAYKFFWPRCEYDWSKRK